MSPQILLACYVGLILLASLAGGWIPLFVQLTHKRMQLAVSLVAGFMLGVSLLHMLPHALETALSVQAAMLWLLVGVLTMFFIERFFSHHHHDVSVADPEQSPDPAALQVEASADTSTDPTRTHAHSPARGHKHDHDHEHAHEHTHPHVHRHTLTWTGAALGLTLHSVLDGVALAASIEAGLSGGAVVPVAGLAVFLVIFLHRPLDSMTLLTLMSVTGWSRATRHLVNALFAMVVPIGAALFFLAAGFLATDGQELVGPALAFSAGLFLCISLSDLLPELQFHQHDRLTLSAALLLGLGLAWAVAAFEPGHDHDHDRDHDFNPDHHPAATTPVHQHDH